MNEQNGTVSDLRFIGFKIEEAGQGLVILTTKMGEEAINVKQVPDAVRLAASGLESIRQALKLVVVRLED